MYFICKAYPVILLMHQRQLRFGMKGVSGFKYFIYCQSVRWQVRRLKMKFMKTLESSSPWFNTLILTENNKKRKIPPFSFRELLFSNSELLPPEIQLHHMQSFRHSPPSFVLSTIVNLPVTFRYHIMILRHVPGMLSLVTWWVERV